MASTLAAVVIKLGTAPISLTVSLFAVVVCVGTIHRLLAIAAVSTLLASAHAVAGPTLAVRAVLIVARMLLSGLTSLLIRVVLGCGPSVGVGLVLTVGVIAGRVSGLLEGVKRQLERNREACLLALPCADRDRSGVWLAF